ncbi:hypothetical protein Daura_31345 [Dactylosporangium aurantiacum]|uniref:Tachylectin n=1 Tax=Dactylosporangium aurantiacum TaxID=35754 RepID=A0A9Q9I8D6_9ACTN|nr:tachylectin-related carbohydrate-binding protein [Dactylosporangium aurantiacum]MDG6107224.1 tachylectin-related carbohydrate-binding protein [Dactylosporangium aurantiacum]UWZ51242.1 hypothetical protein Daura_31345 [Dactylosporangium aurantiacum]
MPRHRTRRAAVRALGLLAAACIGVTGAAFSAVAAPTPAAAASSVGGSISRSEVLMRAGDWYSRRYDSDLTYSMSDYTWDVSRSRQYRRDCSGFVGMAWHLGADPNTQTLDNYADPISRAALEPGDLLNDTTDSESGYPYHAILFGGWENTAKTRFWYYSFGHTPVEKVTGASFSWATLSGHPTSEYRAYRYRKIIDDPKGSGNIYGVLDDGRLTFTVVNAAGVRTHGAVVSSATLGLTPAAMAVLNFNTILFTTATGQLYRVDVITNNTSLVFEPPILLASSGWTLTRLAYDGSGHLYGIAGTTLRRYTVNAAKPDLDDITGWVTIQQSGFSQKTLTTTGPDWILGNHTDGRLLSYRIDGVGDWTGSTLRATTWQVFDQIVSPGGGVYLAHKPDGSMLHYVDANPYDGDGDDISAAKTVDAGGWTQILLSAQPGTIS